MGVQGDNPQKVFALGESELLNGVSGPRTDSAWLSSAGEGLQMGIALALKPVTLMAQAGQRLCRSPICG
jgi:hypothetical protein